MRPERGDSVGTPETSTKQRHLAPAGRWRDTTATPPPGRVEAARAEVYGQASARTSGR